MNIATLWNNYLRHIIDILIVAWIFYRVILLIKGTRAVQILIGIVILAGLTVLTRQVVHLKALTWLLEKFWLAAAVIIAIVFQPELRQALAQLGGEPFKRISLGTELKFMKELIPCIKEMKEKKIGALIVLQQDTGLRNFIETGTILNAQLSKELLLTIFSHGTALHDGAVILDGTRVIAAGCILPVSENPLISKILGTRHRAGVGITEISDAISIVVSEETGQISLCYQGKLEHDLTLEELEKKITDIYRAKIQKSLLRKNNELNKEY